MTAKDEKIAVKVLGSASSMPNMEDMVRTVRVVFADPDGVSCGVCQIPIATNCEDVIIDLHTMVIDRELMVVALFLCPHCVVKWRGQSHLARGPLRPENSIGAPDVKAGDARALH